VVRRTPVRDAAVEAQLDPIAERLDLRGVDVELEVAVAVGPQDLGHHGTVLHAGDGHHAGHQTVDVELGAELEEVDAVAEVRCGRAEHVAPGEGGAGRKELVVGVGQLDGAGGSAHHRHRGASRPLSGPTRYRGTPPTSTAMARRAVPTPGSTTASTTPGARYCTERASVRLPARGTSWAGIWWVMSMTATSGASWRITERTTPANSSRVP
jgi:hypothetical protein